MDHSKDYCLGLDIGTDSVGYAAADETYSLLKFHGEPAWGVTLFDPAAQAAERRAYRVSRRRLDRRQQRVKLLQELFAPEIARIDPRFFIRQAESALYPADKAEPYSLFHDPDFTDADYHRAYPTIHHLINDLMVSDAPHDVRLCYLACAWLVAHRGHFLSQIDTDNITAITDFSSTYSAFRDYLTDCGYQIPWSEENLPAFENALRIDGNVTKKGKALTEALFPGAKPPKEATEAFPFRCDVLIRALAGSKIEAKNLFSNDAYADLPSFTLNADEETMSSLLSQLGDDAQLLIHLKALTDWSLLVNVLGSSGQSISRAKIAIYNQHQSDLKWLKRTIRKYCPGKFSLVFRDAVADNYPAYTDHGLDSSIKKSGQEAFCTFIKKILADVHPDAKDANEFAAAMERIAASRFMPKQKTGDNRVIPYQLYWAELDQLLKRAEGYLPFLAQKDAQGISVSDKIRKIFLFRVPYYVGPLGGHGVNRWAVRKSGRITPWNFDEMVDTDRSEEAFIRRLTNTCTYLPSESVLPRDSLLYHRFMVLNEINPIRINGEPLTVEQKQAIYNDLFMKHPKVTYKQLCSYLQANGLLAKGEKPTGIDETIKSNLAPQHIFRRLLESRALTEQDAEAIIERRTYSEESGRFRRWLKANYPALPEKDVSYLCRQSFKDFGRMSRRFLTAFEGTDKQTGEVTTIMQALWETNQNLGELLSDRYTFADLINSERDIWYKEHPQSIQERLADMYVPTAVRRSVLRALKITEEVTKAFQHPPRRIFVEMARGGKPEDKGKRTETRRDQLLRLLDTCKDEDAPLLRRQLEDMGDSAYSKLQSEKLYLYYLQLGRCMYTGKPIDLASLMNDKLYDIDHIYPRSLVKDDSPHNNKVLVVSEENERKGNGLVPPDIQGKMTGYWKHLLDAGLITKEKFLRLTRTQPFTADEKWGFINRQLTETSQSTKAVAALLKETYPHTEVVYVKSQLAAEFRQAFECIKCREYNDLHHAKDAYLNIVVGSVYHEKFSRRWFSPDHDYNIKTKQLYTHPVICGGKTVWDGTAMLEKVKATLQHNNAHMTRYAYRKQGGFFDQQPRKKGPGLIPRKQGLDPEKYGGYSSASISFFVLVKYTSGKKTDVIFLPVELLFANHFLKEPSFRENYTLKRLAKANIKDVRSVIFPLGDRILYTNTVISLDGYRACITGSSENKILLSCQTPFVADYKTECYIKHLQSLKAKHDSNPNYVYDPDFDKITFAENLQLYDLYIDKLENSIYRHRPNHPLDLLKANRQTFEHLDIWDQITVLLEILKVFSRNNQNINLSLIGGGKSTAESKKTGKLSVFKKSYHDIRIIAQSASGLWETRSQNLLELL